jgi:hypothetical protein
MITDDLCAPQFVRHAHHASPTPSTAPRTRIAFVRFDDVRMDRACTTATGFVVAVMIPPPEEDAYTPQTVALEPESVTEVSGGPTDYAPAFWVAPWASVPLGRPLTPVGVSAIPEPATWGLMLIGFAGVGLALRYRRTCAPRM